MARIVRTAAVGPEGMVVFKKFFRGRRISPGLCDAALQEYFIPARAAADAPEEKGRVHRAHARAPPGGLEEHAAANGDLSGKELAVEGATVPKKGKVCRQLWFYDGTASLHAAELKKWTS